MSILRDFLYLDRPLVRNFLAQVEGGVVDESTERATNSGKGGVGAKLGVGNVGLSADKSKEHTTQSESVVKQVATSEFNRLYDYLEQKDLVVLDEVSDPKVFEELQRKQFIEIDARVQQGGMQQLFDVIGTFTALMPAMEKMGAEVSTDNEAMAGMQALAALNSGDGPVSVVATVAGTMQLKVALDLTKAGLLTDSWDTEATVLLKIQRIIREGDTYLVGNPLGGLMGLMPDADRSQMIESFRSSDMGNVASGDIEIKGPALVGTPVAIYR